MLWLENPSSRASAVDRSPMMHHAKGTFILQHNGTMRNGAASMQVTVVPDSGTGDLVASAER